MERRAIRNFPWLLLFIPVIFIVLVVRHYGVNVAYYDDYHMVPVFQAIDKQKNPVSELWSLNNENREVVPKIVMATVAYISHWNIRDQMFVNIIIAAISAGLLFNLVRLTIGQYAFRILALLLVSFWIFSPAQAENWLWGWEAVWYICVAAVLLAIVLLNNLHPNKPSKYLVGGAISSATVASFSLANGLLIWPIGLAMLLIRKQPGRIIRSWVVSAFLVGGLYFYHYTKPASSPPLTAFLHEPLNFVRFFFAFLGRPISDTMTAAMTFGSILFLLLIPTLYLCWSQRKNIQKSLPWLAIAAFALSACLVADFARLGGGVGNSLSSRYATISILYILGIFGALITALDNSRLRLSSVRVLVLTIAVVSTPLLWASYSNGIDASRLRYQQMTQIRECTHLVKPTDSCLHLANLNDLSLSLSQLNYLKQKHWAGY